VVVSKEMSPVTNAEDRHRALHRGPYPFSFQIVALRAGPVLAVTLDDHPTGGTPD
jgi:hypothetical protein